MDRRSRSTNSAKITNRIFSALELETIINIVSYLIARAVSAVNRMSDKRDPWKKVRPRMKALERSVLEDILGGLWALSAENREFIESRFTLHGRAEDALMTFKKLVDREFDMSRHNAPLRIDRARKAIHDYGKATGDEHGTLELLVHLVEKGTAFTLAYGDIDERFYNGLELVFEEVVSQLSGGDCSVWLTVFRPRLAKVVDSASDMGWGYGDALNELFHKLNRLAPRVRGRPKGHKAPGRRQQKLDV